MRSTGRNYGFSAPPASEAELSWTAWFAITGGLGLVLAVAVYGVLIHV